MMISVQAKVGYNEMNNVAFLLGYYIRTEFVLTHLVMNFSLSGPNKIHSAFLLRGNRYVRSL